jgi:hypothetical protein
VGGVVERVLIVPKQADIQCNRLSREKLELACEIKSSIASKKKLSAQWNVWYRKNCCCHWGVFHRQDGTTARWREFFFQVCFKQETYRQESMHPLLKAPGISNPWGFLLECPVLQNPAVTKPINQKQKACAA